MTAAASPRTLVARGAAAGLLPFPAHDAVGRRDHDAITRFGLGASGPVRAAFAPHPGAAPTTAGAAHRPARGPARHGGGNGRPIPPAPLAPPGNAGAGGVAGASGGAATGVWCALLAGTLVFLAQSFRRHRFRLVAPAPGGVVFLLQRPG